MVIMENSSANLSRLRDEVLTIYPEARIKAFTDGDQAFAWCENHSSDIDLFFGNWWNDVEEPHGMEGANIAFAVHWLRKPTVILCGEGEIFRSWSEQGGADAYLPRPITQKLLRQTLKALPKAQANTRVVSM